MSRYCGSNYRGVPETAGIGSSYTAQSPLESAVEYAPAVRMSEQETVQAHHFPESPAKSYSSGKYSEGMYLQPTTPRYHFVPDNFLNSVPTEFISSRDSQQKEIVGSLVQDAFEATTGKKLPKDIMIRICTEKEMKKLHSGWHKGVAGFSINRKGFGMSEIFVKEDELARLMLTVGHEIGHVLTFPMADAIDEEAKAFAFSLAWMNAVKENNIGGLCEAVNPMPAKNGLHNVAFDFLAGQMKKGKIAIDVYSELVNGKLSISNEIPLLGGG